MREVTASQIEFETVTFSGVGWPQTHTTPWLKALGPRQNHPSKTQGLHKYDSGDCFDYQSLYTLNDEHIQRE